MNAGRIADLSIHRRGFLALGGGAVATGVLAGCGTEPEEPSEGRDAEILSEAVVGEENAAAALRQAASGAEGDDRETIDAMATAASDQAAALQQAAEGLGEAPAGDFDAESAGGDPLATAVAATNQAVRAYRRGAGQFSTEDLRRSALEWMVSDGARLALLNGLLDQDLAPYAFVTGLEEPPLEFPEDADDDEEEEATTTSTTSTESTSTTSTSTDPGGPVSASNRREALRTAALAAGALAAGGLVRPVAAAAQDTEQDDLRDFLVEAIGLEQIAAFAYETAAEANGIEQSLKPSLIQLRDQEQAHAVALRSALDSLGFDPPEPPDSADDTGVFDEVEGLDDEAATKLKETLGQIGDITKPEEYIEYLISLEQQQLDYYVTSAPTLPSEDLMSTCAEIVGNQAQHLVILDPAAGVKPTDLLSGFEVSTADSSE